MAPSARQISLVEWNTHEDTIKHLYYVDKLPLQSKKEGKRTLIKVMEDEHGFLASPSQYESKFRQWGFAKNLGKREWQKLLWQQEELQKQGREARILISGSVVGEPSRKRARRWVEPEQHIGYTRPPERQAHVEVRDGTGPWLKYTDDEYAVELSAFTQNPAHQNTNTRSDEDTNVSTSIHIPSTHSSYEAGGQQILVPIEVAPPPAASPSFSDLLREYDGSSFYNDHFQTTQQNFQYQFSFSWEYQNVNDIGTDDQLASGSPFNEAYIDSMLHNSLVQPEILTLGGGFEGVSLEQGYRETTDISAHESLSSSQELQTRPKGLAEALLECARQTLANTARQFRGPDLPNVEDVIDNLESLLPDGSYLETTIPDSQIIEKNASFGPGIRALLYSITNGFAGLRNVPRGSILKLIRKDQQIQSHVAKLLNVDSSSLAKPLADNLFRAAIESCDPQAVAMIMSMTRNSPEIAIDPNNIVCELDGRDYTPVELASKFRNIEIVQALLTAKADPNKTYSKADWSERGALELAIRKWGKFEQMNLKLVRLLLDCGAEIRISLVEAVVRWGYGGMELLELLMNEISDSQHTVIFESPYFLKGVIECLRTEAATGIVQRFFAACKSTNCGNCASSHPELLRDMLAKAAKRGSLDLVELLTPHTKERQLALSAAVRIGNSRLIKFLLDKGATVNGRGGHLDGFDSNEYGHNLSPITTPLAEAIRAQDHSQVQEFELRGALVCIAQLDHFLAAVFAAAETGDVAYLQRVLKLVPAFRRDHLTSALTMAIRNDHSEAALVLLGAGANVNHRSGGSKRGLPLIEALKRQNKRVVNAILESDLDPNQHFRIASYEATYLELAVSWGDLEIIDALALMGADLNAGRGALTAAVNTRNKPLVDYLLRLGVPINARAEPSPLEAAVKNGDHDMIVFLMTQGASVKDSKAFMYAAKHDLSAYSMFLSAFEKLPPMERKGFGGDLLRHFITQNDLEALDALFKAR